MDATALTMRKHAEQLTDRLAAVAEPNRLLILQHLRDRELHASGLADLLGISASLASHHLSALVEVGLIERERHGPYVRFRARPDRLQELMTEVDELCGPLEKEPPAVVVDVRD